MGADSITLGLHALEGIALPRPGTARGWAARLAGGPPVLAAGARALRLALVLGAEGLVLAEAFGAGGRAWPAGTPIAVQRVAGVFLVRIAGRACGLVAAGDGLLAAAEGPQAPRALAGFGAGTRIDTPDGPRPVEALVPGDLVSTLANGSRPLRWVGRRRTAAAELLAEPGLRPVVFAAGTAGNGRALLVSPGQRLLIDDWRAEVFFGEDRVLAAAEALVDDARVRVVVPPEGVDYVILLCDRHEILLAEGALVESFHPGATGLAGLTAAERADLAGVVAEADLIRRPAACPIVRLAEARALRLPG